MDSSSIVCVADALLREEPNWNEKPHFTLVEQKRGGEGLHVPVDASHYAAALFEKQEFAVVPGDLGRTYGHRHAVSEFIRWRGYGSVLSGIGGDEFAGGVPTPIPELADLLAQGQVRLLAKQLMKWALSQRRPWIHVWFQTLRSFAPPCLGRIANVRKPPSWVTPLFRRRFRSVLNGYDKPLTLWGYRPSFQENLSALEALRRQLAASHAGSKEPVNTCYPYLDCDLLQFLFNVPRQLLVEPGRRRALMRRSLSGIVPDEIINRKRKAYVSRAPRTAITKHWENMQSLTHDMIAESLGIVSSSAFRQTLEDVRNGKDVALVPIQRTLSLECWLHNLSHSSVLPKTDSAPEHNLTNATIPAPL